MNNEMKEVAKKYFEKKGMKKLTCCICGCDFWDWSGCNPWPVVDISLDENQDAVCCHECDYTFVQNARMGAEPGTIMYVRFPVMVK